jgi:alpha-1,4-digalacturonate transport system substrate-binding protein
MKRFVSLLLAILVIALAACATPTAEPTKAPPPPPSSSSVASSVAPTKAPEPTKAPVSSSSTSSAAASSAPAQKVELRIVWYNDGNEGDVMRAILDKYQAANPNITVKLDTIAYADMDKILPAQLEAGNPPDMARLTSIQTYAKYYLDMTPYMTDAKAWAANWAPEYLQALRLPNDKTSLSGFPTQFTVSGPFINRTLFKQANVPVPSDTKEKVTWQEWVDAAKKVATATKTPYAVAIDRSGHRTFGPMMGMCANFVDSMFPTKFSVDNKGIRDFANMLVSWHKEKITPAEIWVGGGGGYAAGNTYFTNGQLVFYYSGNWQIGQFDKLIADKFEWDAVPNPYGDCGSTGMPGGAAFVAFKGSKNPKEVTKLIEYLTSDAVLAEFSAKSLFLPGSLSLSKKGVQYPSANKQMNVFVKEVGKISTQASNLQWGPYITPFNVETRDRLSQVITGELTLDEAIQRIQKKMDDTLAAAQ